MPERVVITGMGVVSPNGVGIDAFRASLRGGRSGLGRLSRLNTAKLYTKIGGEVDDASLEPLWHHEAPMDQFDRSTAMALITAEMALSDARVQQTEGLPLKRGLIVGSAAGPVGSVESIYRDFYREHSPYARPSSVGRTLPNGIVYEIARHFGLNKIGNLVSTACSSGLVAIALGRLYIEAGMADIVLAGGVDAALSEDYFRLWDSFRVMTRDFNDDPLRGSRPFSATRSGMVMSEGCGFVVLERESIAEQRGAEQLAELSGTGQTCGREDLIGASPDSLASCMAEALANASLPRNDLACIFAHGASMPGLDRAEAEAIRTVFGELSDNLPVTSIKSTTGHALGASGPLSVVAALISMREGFLPPTTNLEDPDSQCPLTYVANEAQPMAVDSALVNAFAFGGTNLSLILRKA